MTQHKIPERNGTEIVSAMAPYWAASREGGKNPGGNETGTEIAPIIGLLKFVHDEDPVLLLLFQNAEQSREERGSSFI